MPTLRRAHRGEAARAALGNEGAEDLIDNMVTPERPRDGKAIGKTTPKRRGGADEVDDVVATTPAKDGEGEGEAPSKAARSARIPSLVVFPLVAGISFITASLGYSVVSELTKGELATVSRSQETPEEIYILAGWRV